MAITLIILILLAEAGFIWIGIKAAKTVKIILPAVTNDNLTNKSLQQKC